MDSDLVACWDAPALLSGSLFTPGVDAFIRSVHRHEERCCLPPVHLAWHNICVSIAAGELIVESNAQVNSPYTAPCLYEGELYVRL